MKIKRAHKGGLSARGVRGDSDQKCYKKKKVKKTFEFERFASDKGFFKKIRDLQNRGKAEAHRGEYRGLGGQNRGGKRTTEPSERSKRKGKTQKKDN